MPGTNAPCPAGAAQQYQRIYAAPATSLMGWFPKAQYTWVNSERPCSQQREIKVNLHLLITAKLVLRIGWRLHHAFLGVISCSHWEAVKTLAQHRLWTCSGFGLLVGCRTSNLSWLNQNEHSQSTLGKKLVAFLLCTVRHVVIVFSILL